MPVLDALNPGGTSLRDVQGLLRPFDKGHDAHANPWAEVGVKKEDGVPLMTTVDVRVGLARTFIGPGGKNQLTKMFQVAEILS